MNTFVTEAISKRVSTVFGTPNLVTPYAAVPGGSPFPYTLDRANPIFSLPISANYMVPDMATPYVQHYSFTVEQQFLRTLSVQVGYVGNTSRKLYYQRDAAGLPHGWITRVKRAIRTLAWRYNADRMVMDYVRESYLPAAGGDSCRMPPA